MIRRRFDNTNACKLTIIGLNVTYRLIISLKKYSRIISARFDAIELFFVQFRTFKIHPLFVKSNEEKIDHM